MKKLSERQMISIGIIILILAYIPFISRTTIPYILDDEFGYWANAAYIAGYDWTSVSSLNPYYSFGYSLILSLLMIIRSYHIRYAVAVILNIAAQIAACLILWKTVIKLMPEVDRKRLFVLSVVSALYSTNIFYAKTTQAETALYFVFVLLFAFLVKAVKEECGYAYLLCGVCCGYIICIHMRCVALAIALAAVLLYKAVRDASKKERIYIAATLIIIALSVLIMRAGKDFFIENVYKSGEQVVVNTFEGQTGKVEYAASHTGLLSLVENAAGKVVYLILATFGTAYFAVEMIVKKIVSEFKEKKSKDIFIYIFLFLSLAGTIGISSIYFIGNTTISDMLVYGRYSEHILAPYFVIGFVYLEERLDKKPGMALFIPALLISLLSAIVLAVLKTYPSIVIREANIAGISPLAYDGKNISHAGWFITVILFVICFFLFCYFCRYMAKDKRMIVIPATAALIWIIMGNFLTGFQMKNRERYETISLINDILIDNGLDRVTYVGDDVGGHWTIDILRFMNRDIEIDVTESYFGDDEYIIFNRSSHGWTPDKRKYECIAQAVDLQVYKSKEDE